MATFICMDGLGGRPEISFAFLKKMLEQTDHRVILASVRGIQTHNDRIQRVVENFYKERSASRKGEREGDDRIFLVGLSAGGDTVLRVAGKRYGDTALTGVIILSPAIPLLFEKLPRFMACLMTSWYFMTRYLAMSMMGLNILINLLMARTIRCSDRQYARLIDPVSPDLREEIIKKRSLTIPGPEARQLAFNPKPLEKYTCPTLLIYGDKDQWIAPRAHRKLCTVLESCTTSPVTCHKIEGAGHLVLASDRREEVIQKILNWVEKIPRAA